MERAQVSGRSHPSVVWSWPDSARSLLPFLLVLLAAVYAITRLTPPAAVPATAPPAEFSSGRAMQKLLPIVKQAHPMGSSSNIEVRDYLLGELSALGLSPEVQRGLGINHRRRNPVPVGSVENIVVRLPGTANSRALLLVAHYDSVPTSTGASDDGASVAALLETLRALKVSAPLKNDVITLFTDGEEPGLLGSLAFAEQHPWAKEVGLALNFEALGTSGPTVMFETSARNGWLVGEFARAAPHPVANSLTYEMYKFLPFDTDMTAFKERGLAGLNFAYLNGAVHHHLETDDRARLDERSLQHQGASALALTRHFGNLDLNNRPEGNAVYFDLLGLTLFHYPAGLALPLAILVLLTFAGVVWLGLRRGRLTVGRMGLGALAALACLVLIPLLVTLAWMLIRSSYPQYRAFPQGGTYNGGFYMISFAAVAVAVASLVYVAFGRKVSLDNLLVGGLVWWLVLTLLTSLYLPGASYLFTWPLLFILIGLGINFTAPERFRESGKGPAVRLLFALPGVLILVPLIYLVFTATGVAAAGPIIVLLTLLLLLLIPQMEFVYARKGWVPAVGALLLGLSFLAVGHATADFDAEHPKPNHLFYALSADSGKATWGSMDRRPDEWTSRYLTAAPEQGGLFDYIPSSYEGYLKKEAPAAALAGPEVEVLEDVAGEGLRTLRLRLISPRRAPVVSVFVYAAGEITEAAVNGTRIDRIFGDRFSLSYYSLPAEGAELSLKIKSPEPVRVRTTDISYGLPDLPETPLSARPPGLTASPLTFSDQTLVTKTFKF